MTVDPRTMKKCLFAFCASVVMLCVAGVPTVQNHSEQEKLELHRCQLIDGPTKALYTGERPVGWKEPGFSDGSWTDADFPLAENVFCPQLLEYGAPGGAFPVNTRILTRNTFSLDRMPLDAQIYVVADNSAKVFVNGALVFTTPEQGGCDGVSTEHRVDLALDGTTPLRVGENVVAVKGQDVGGQSFLNVRMEITETVPCKVPEVIVPEEETIFECGVINGATKALYTGEKPLGWKEPGFNDDSWTNVAFPLAENVVCPQLAAFGTPGGPFPANQRVLTRNTFFLHRFPQESDPNFFATMHIVADNYAKVFVNGVAVFTTPNHGGCDGVSTRYEVKLAVDGTTPLVVGENVVAVNGQDFGGQSFLHVELQIGSGQACELFSTPPINGRDCPPDQFFQIGADLNGELPGYQFGWFVVMSADGNRIAANVRSTTGERFGGGGYVSIFELQDSGNWMPLGQRIDNVWENGEFRRDNNVNQMAMSADGNRVVIGHKFAEVRPFVGRVDVFEYNESTKLWQQLGSDLRGMDDDLEKSFGRWVSISGDGRRIAVGIPLAPGGVVRVFDLIDGDWEQVGDDLHGPPNVTLFGTVVELSADGSRLIASAPNTFNSPSGYVRVYEFISGSWTQVGNEIVEDVSGYAVDITADGSRIAIVSDGQARFSPGEEGVVRVYDLMGRTWTIVGNPITNLKWVLASEGGLNYLQAKFSGDGNRLFVGESRGDSGSGEVRAFEFDVGSGDWVQVGQNIVGKVMDDRSGTIATSFDGSRVVVGAHLNDDNGSDAGQVRVFEFCS